MIWVVDDHADTAELVVNVLRRRGVAAEAFEDANKVLEALELRCPELLILDVMMPVIDGIELLRRLRSDTRWKDIPVIIYSADFTKSRMEEAMGLGASAYFVKGAVGFGAILNAVSKLTHLN